MKCRGLSEKGALEKGNLDYWGQDPLRRERVVAQALSRPPDVFSHCLSVQTRQTH